MSKNFDGLAKDYLRDLEAVYKSAVKTGQVTPELSYRPALDKFLQQLAHLINRNADVIFEPRKQGRAGRPDWRFYDTRSYGIYGYVEAKGLDINTLINQVPYLKQVGKYLELGSKVILTDGIDFIFFDDRKTFRKVSLITKPLLSNWNAVSPNPLIEVEFRKFFDTPSFRRGTEYDLVKDVARLAIQIAEAVRELSDLPPEAATSVTERKTILTLGELKKVLEEHHDPALKTPKIFADFVAQVLSFGLLYAHRIIAVEDTPAEKLEKIKDFWKRTTAKFDAPLRPFRAVIEILDDELESTGGIGSAYRELMLILAHFELSEKRYEKPDYHTLYENFLEIYDKKTKNQFGAYYTPPELTDYTVRLTEAIINSTIIDVSVYDPGNRIIDPCCGTGTFVESLSKYAPLNNERAEISGFEILPAPYALAHYRMAMLSATGSSKLLEKDGIVLTNTLRDEITSNELSLENASGKNRSANLPVQLNLLWEEQKEARESSRPPLTLVIGNPPSSDENYKHATGNGFKIIDALMEDFRPPEAKKTSRSNTQQQLSNPFIKFLRWAGAKVEQHPGVIAFILPESFADKENFFYARKWLIENFPKIWVLDIDEDLRTGEYSSNLFKTQQGRLLLIALTSPETEISNVEINYNSISSLSKSEKKDYLLSKESPEEMKTDFKRISLSDSDYSLRPSKASKRKGYELFWSIRPVGNNPEEKETYVFARQCSAVKLAPSSLFIHVDSGILIRRSLDAEKFIPNPEGFVEKWFLGQSKPPGKNKLTNEVMLNLSKSAKNASTVINYSYRPFLTVSMLFAEEALQSLKSIKNSGTRTRPELEKAFEKEGTVGIAIAPAPKDIGKLHRFATFCWNLPDNDLCARQNARVLCNSFPEYKKGQNWNPTPILNVNPVLLNHFGKDGRLNGEDIAEAMVFYSYAILSSDKFLSSFEGELHKSADSQNPLRIPIVNEIDFFINLSNIGRRLADLERPDCKEPLLNHYEKLKGIYKNEFQLNSYKINLEDGVLRLSESPSKGITIDNIPPSVLSLRIAGHEVVKQWLKMHSFKYSRMNFSNSMFVRFLSLLSNIERQLKFIEEADKEVEKLLDNPELLLLEIN